MRLVEHTGLDRQLVNSLPVALLAFGSLRPPGRRSIPRMLLASPGPLSGPSPLQLNKTETAPTDADAVSVLVEHTGLEPVTSTLPA